MKTAAVLLIGAVIAAGMAVASAPTAGAGCQEFFSPWGGGKRCDSPIDENGFFQRCDSGAAMGFGIPERCYQVDSNNLGSQPPWIGP